MNQLYGTTLLIISIYLLTMPHWLMQVFGASLAAIGFIILASFISADKRKRKPQFMSTSEILDELGYHREYIAEINENESSHDLENNDDIYAQVYARIEQLEKHIHESSKR